MPASAAPWCCSVEPMDYWFLGLSSPVCHTLTEPVPVRFSLQAVEFKLKIIVP
jgi:hypothetical protein